MTISGVVSGVACEVAEYDTSGRLGVVSVLMPWQLFTAVSGQWCCFHRLLYLSSPSWVEHLTNKDVTIWWLCRIMKELEGSVRFGATLTS